MATKITTTCDICSAIMNSDKRDKILVGSIGNGTRKQKLEYVDIHICLQCYQKYVSSFPLVVCKEDYMPDKIVWNLENKELGQ